MPPPSPETGVEFEGEKQDLITEEDAAGRLKGSRALSGGGGGEGAQLQICSAKGIGQSIISRSSGGSGSRVLP